jgi:hypothetical protein
VTQNDWFGFQFAESGFYDKHQKLVFELFPSTGETKSDAIRRGILAREGWFTHSDIKQDFPGASGTLVQKIFHELTEARLLEAEGVKKDLLKKVNSQIEVFEAGKTSF